MYMYIQISKIMLSAPAEALTLCILVTNKCILWQNSEDRAEMMHNVVYHQVYTICYNKMILKEIHILFYTEL